jgi:hypothetical protein
MSEFAGTTTTSTSMILDTIIGKSKIIEPAGSGVLS